ncbi:MAG TPA: tetratricopeptide repeat protein, partial [Kofleriaceae bacterium]|nr:tetratricopeptide repeat protein [Kofleriaceae bacterium]
MTRWLVCWLAWCVVTIATARADDPLAKPDDAIARDYLQQGNRFYHLHELARAIDAYKAGSLRDDTPVFLYNLAQCHRQLGNYAESIWHYERFVARARPTGLLRQTIDRFVRDMKAELGRPLAIESVEPWYADGVGWSLASAGAIAALAGGYLWLDAADLDDQANHEPRQSVREGLHDRAGARRGIGAVVGLSGIGV